MDVSDSKSKLPSTLQVLLDTTALPASSLVSDAGSSSNGGPSHLDYTVSPGPVPDTPVPSMADADVSFRTVYNDTALDVAYNSSSFNTTTTTAADSVFDGISSSDLFNASFTAFNESFNGFNESFIGFNESSFYNVSDVNDTLNTNASHAFPYPPFFLSDGAKAGLIVLYSLTTLLSICGNVLVVLVFTRGRRCRTDIRPFLINLAVADLVMALFCMPFTFTLVMMKTWVFSKPMCPVVLFVQHLSVSASVFTNVAIGSDRFLVVTLPLKSRVTTDRAKYVLVGIWLGAIALSSVQLVVGEARELPDGLGGVVVTCDEVWGTQGARRTFTMFVLFITYIIPLTILAVAYSIVGVLLWRRTTPGNADETRDLHQLQSKRKVVKMLIIVVTMFGLCWLPLHTFFLVIDFNPELMMYESLEEERFFVALYYSVHWLAMSNSFANPFIYSFTNDSFRADLAYIFYVLFPFCKCLKKLATRQFSTSYRDHRLHTAFRRSPSHSPYPGELARNGHKSRRHYNGNRIYLALSQDSPMVGERTTIAHGCGDHGPACYRSAVKTTSTYV